MDGWPVAARRWPVAAPARAVPIEYAAEGSAAPMVALRDGRFKFIFCDSDPPQLFDLEADPDERVNLAKDPARGGARRRVRGCDERQWNLAAFDRAVRESQARRHLVYKALRQGSHTAWEFAAAAGRRAALHAQPHGSERAGGKQALSARRIAWRPTTSLSAPARPARRWPTGSPRTAAYSVIVIEFGGTRLRPVHPDAGGAVLSR